MEEQLYRAGFEPHVYGACMPQDDGPNMDNLMVVICDGVDGRGG